MIIEAYKQLGGIHPETAAIKNVLAAKSVTAPHTSNPWSEAMLLGIGGGLGAGYILWEFERYASALIVLGFRNRWNYPVQFMDNLCTRIGVKTIVHETGGKKKAAQQLSMALQKQDPAIIWLDPSYLPYFFLPTDGDGQSGHILTIYGADGETAFIDDRSQKPLTAPIEALAKARARVGSFKHRLILLEPTDHEVDLETAVFAGITDCIEYLGKPSTSFALPTLKKWANMMTDTKNKKGWPVIFQHKAGLYSTLRSVYEGIILNGTGGDALRGLYADFLDEAGTVLNNNKMKVAAAEYRQLARCWRHFAELALPDNIPVLQETKQLITQKYHLLFTRGGEGFNDMAIVSQKLNEMQTELNHQFPMSESEAQQLFSQMKEALLNIFEAEKQALATLKAIIK